MSPVNRLEGLKIVSSNKTKINEYRRLSGNTIEVQPGTDLPEILGTPDQIALYKALEAGEGLIVEDSILVVDGEPLIDIKWRLEELTQRAQHEPCKLVWEVRLAYLRDGLVKVFLGTLEGRLRPWDVAGSGYDPIFNVLGVGQSLARLEIRGLKDQYSARARAFKALLADQHHISIDQSALPAWTGAYQNT
ncbi:non-canonical purine NTP pyrophosphatase [Pseudomonas sp. S1(2024)]|uniref:non-canonical purine NTP pyrophosphatase n=1 Tax=Pseudomonas sp. S1(2024) TaxID=3390191 RepID=UPI003979E9E6